MAETLIMERMEQNLTRLKLPRIRDILQELVKRAEMESWSYQQLLDTLLEEEVAQKEQRRVDTTLKISGLPFIKTIDEFDFTFQPHLNKQTVMNLFDLTFIPRKENIVFLGPPGVGKSHLAVALAVKACQAGQTIYFTTMVDLIDKLKKDKENGKTGRGRSYYKSSVVIVDEVGYTPITAEECHLFYQFVATRYERSSTVLTSNKAFIDWAEMFHDPVIVTAILDRLLHHSVVVNIKGNSFRLKGKLSDVTDKE
jgi:DNA replication protein DnaC